MSNLALLVGLGNPGQQYAQTRHNAGFWFISMVAEQYNIPLSPQKKFRGLVGRGQVEGVDVRLLLPTTFMNKSGQAVSPLVDFYQIAPQQILIAHDELDLPTGKIKLKTGGGHGGHNGLRDIVPHIGSDFHRLRIGIDHPGHKSMVSGHVLSKPSQQQQQLLQDGLAHVMTQMRALVGGDIQTAMNAINSYTPVV